VKALVLRCVNPFGQRALDIKQAATQALNGLGARASREALLEVAQQLNTLGMDLADMPTRKEVVDAKMFIDAAKANLMQTILNGGEGYDPKA
jgi:hypothetical protein